MADDAHTDVLVEKRGQVAWITINRPDRFNALDYASYQQIAAAFKEVGFDSSIGVVVLTGAGDKSFSSGGFLADLTNFDQGQARRLYALALETYQTMRRIPQPVIAAVNGYAIGGGNEFVICSDLAIASEHARFGQTGPRIGSSPIYGGNNMLSLTIGEKRAREVVYLCRQYTAQEALEMGWINKVVPHAELYDEVQKWADEMLDKSPAYLEVSKIQSNVWWESMMPTMELARQSLLRLAGGEQMTEGATAFMEKRKPDFRQFRK